MIVNTNISYMFNKVYLNLMKEIKDNNADIKVKLKTNYKVFDKKSNEYVTRMVLNMDEDITSVLFGSEDIIDSTDILNFELYIGVTVLDIMKTMENDESKNTFKYYMYILMVFGYLYKLDDIDDDKKDILLKKTVEIINCVDTKKFENEKEFEIYLDDILDDDLRVILYKMYKDRLYVTESVMKIDNDELGGLEFLNNTKIGELAKEISSSIDMSKLNMNNPGEMLNMENLFSGSNNMLGDIIQTVGTKITQKIQSGDINQEDLMGEALNMMGTLNSSGHGDMMTQMMGMMSGMMPGMGNNNNNNGGGENKTKDRLQRKLVNKNKK